jgi:hypothetical protein
VIVCPSGVKWNEVAPRKVLVVMGPVVEVLPAFSEALQQALTKCVSIVSSQFQRPRGVSL